MSNDYPYYIFNKGQGRQDPPQYPDNTLNKILWVDGISFLGQPTGAITSWWDKAGVVGDLTAFIASPPDNGATLEANSLNGLPGIYFNRNGSGMYSPTFTAYTSNVLSIYLVAKAASYLANQRFVSMYASGIADYNDMRTLCVADTTTGSVEILRNGTLSKYNNAYNSPFIYSLRFDGSFLFYSITNQVAGSVSNSQTVGNFGFTNINIGHPPSEFDPTGAQLGGRIYELIVIGRLMPLAEHNSMLSYLSTKWGIAS